MSQKDRIAEIEDLTVKEFKSQLRTTIDNLREGIKPGNSIELLATTLKITHLGDDLKLALEKWLQYDLWEEIEKSETEV